MIRQLDKTFKVTYHSEKEEDKLLNEIKKICFGYLIDKTIMDDLGDDELFSMRSFLVVKYEDMEKLKNSFQLKSYFPSFIDISNMMDVITLSDSIYSSSEQKNLRLLAKDINSIMESLSICFTIVDKIYQKRNKVKQ